MQFHKRVYAQIDLDAIAYNMDQMRQNLPDSVKMVGVIKTDGYGHGAVPIAEMLEQMDYVWGFAAATAEEALDLRKHGIQKPVLILGCVFEEQLEELIRQDIRCTVYMEEMAEKIAEEARRQKKTAYVHIKIDTGMGRIGFPANEESIDTIRRISDMSGLKTEGVFTHFSKADEEDPTYTIWQHKQFEWVQEQMRERGIYADYFHCDNSAGIIEYPQYHHDLVRAGISVYGIYPSDEVKRENVRLKPAMELISHVAFVKEVPKDTKISYGGTFQAPSDLRIATIPVGYGDGYSRALSNKGAVLIHGKRAPIVGRICMDQFMVDVTDIPETKFGDRVVLLGKDGEESIRIEELSSLTGRFPYEFFCDLNKRIPRVYKKDRDYFELKN